MLWDYNFVEAARGSSSAAVLLAALGTSSEGHLRKAGTGADDTMFTGRLKTSRDTIIQRRVIVFLDVCKLIAAQYGVVYRVNGESTSGFCAPC